MADSATMCSSTGIFSVYFVRTVDVVGVVIAIFDVVLFVCVSVRELFCGVGVGHVQTLAVWPPRVCGRRCNVQRLCIVYW